jgi:hypothetical protein
MTQSFSMDDGPEDEEFFDTFLPRIYQAVAAIAEGQSWGVSAFRKVFWVHTHIPYLRAVSTSTPTLPKVRTTARPSRRRKLGRPCPRMIRP